MKQNLRKVLVVLTCITVLATVPFAVSAKQQNSNNDKKIEVKSEQKAGKKVEQTTKEKAVEKDKTNISENKINTCPKTVVKKDVKKDKETYKAKKDVLNKLNTVEKKITGIEIDVDKLTVQINAYTTTGSAITTTGSAINTTCSAIKVDKRASLRGFVNGTNGKLTALSNKVKEAEKSLKAIKPDSALTEKYNSLINRINTVKAEIEADKKLLKSIKIKN
jgi:hypothetical protein